MNVVLVTTRLFSRPASGGELCTARLVRALLRAGHCVRVLGRGDAGATMGTEASAEASAGAGALRVHSVGPLVEPFSELPHWDRARSLLGALWHRRAWTVQRLQEPGVQARVRAVLAGLGSWPVDALVVDHLQVLDWLPAEAPALPRPVVVMHNLEAEGHAEQAAREAAHGRWLAAAAHRREHGLVQRLEQRVLAQAAAVACLSGSDASVWRTHANTQACARARRGAAPLVVDVLAGHPLRQAVPPAPSQVHVQPVTPGPQAREPSVRRIGLVGTWTWGPNRDGLLWFLRHVVPHLGAHSRVLLAGPGSQQLALPAGVQALGWMDDLDGFYASLDVVALPSHCGSGVHEKAIEALALAPLVVATPHALRGLGTVLPPHVMVADSATRFAQLCMHAQLDAARRVQAADQVHAWAAGRQRAHDAALARCLQAGRVARPAPARGEPMAA